MSTLRRSTRAAASRKRAGENPEETVGESQTRTETCPPEPEPQIPERTPVPAEQSAVTDTVTSDISVEKENRVHTMDPNPPKHSKTAAHAQTCASSGRTIPLGKPKSGRVWKDRNKQRFSALLRDKPLRSSWQKKMDAKREKELVKKYHQQIKDQKAQEKQEKRKRREETLKRREENERKAEIVQVIRNTAKLKRMKKKQLRKIEKRDTLAVLQKTPPAVKKAGKGE